MKINSLQQHNLILANSGWQKECCGFCTTCVSLVNENTGDLVDPAQSFWDVMWSERSRIVLWWGFSRVPCANLDLWAVLLPSPVVPRLCCGGCKTPWALSVIPLGPFVHWDKERACTDHLWIQQHSNNSGMSLNKICHVFFAQIRVTWRALLQAPLYLNVFCSSRHKNGPNQLQ